MAYCDLLQLPHVNCLKHKLIAGPPVEIHCLGGQRQLACTALAAMQGDGDGAVCPCVGDVACMYKDLVLLAVPCRVARGTWVMRIGPLGVPVQICNCLRELARFMLQPVKPIHFCVVQMQTQ